MNHPDEDASLTELGGPSSSEPGQCGGVSVGCNPMTASHQFPDFQLPFTAPQVHPGEERR